MLPMENPRYCIMLTGLATDSRLAIIVKFRASLTTGELERMGGPPPTGICGDTSRHRNPDGAYEKAPSFYCN